MPAKQARTPRKAPPPPAAAEWLEGFMSTHNKKKALPVPKFQELLAKYNERDPDQSVGLSGVYLYLYRVFPKVDHKQSGRNENYLEKFVCVTPEGALQPLPVDIVEYVTTKYGGGQFNVSLNDKNKPELHQTGANDQQIAYCAFAVDDVQFPPILDPRDLVGSDPNTAAWAMRQVSRQVYERDDSQGYPRFTYAQTGAHAPAAADAGLTGVVNLLLKRLDAPQQNPAAVMEMMSKGYQQLMIDAGQHGSRGGDSATAAMVTGMFGMMGQMMSAQAQASAQTMTLILEVVKAQSAPAPTVVKGGRGGLRDIIEDVTALKELVGAGAEEGGLTSILKAAAPVVAPLLLRGFMPNGPGAAAPAIEQPPPAAAPAAQQVDFGALVNRFMLQEKDGSDLATALEGMYDNGAQMYDQLVKQGGGNIVTALLQHPAHGAYFNAHTAELTAFIDSFIAYDTPEATN